MSLKEIRKLDEKSKSRIQTFKYHWNKIDDSDQTINPPTTSMLKTLLRNGNKGAYFHPMNKWVSFKWLQNNGYQTIAERILFLISVYGDSKRFMITKRNSNDNLILGHVEVSWIKEYVS